MEAQEIHNFQLKKARHQFGSLLRAKNTRRRGLSLLVVICSVWLSLDTFQRCLRQMSGFDHGSVPKFTVDLTNAEIAEFQLLPDVGQKTASEWVEHRQDSQFVLPSSKEELESLPRVGMKRAESLAPHLLETEK